jgi:hypothetical protein
MQKRWVIPFLLWITFGVQSSFGGTLHGFVREKSSNEPVIMANVWIQSTSIGTTTNMKGYYVLSSLAPGEYDIVFRFIGFKTALMHQVLSDGQDTELNVQLEQEPIVLKAEEVTAERENRKLDIKPSQIAISAPRLREIPQIAEPDLFRAIQFFPGVATLSDFSAGLYIRGGSADQNLILLDQIDVYNPNHMFGFFSTFNTDAVKSVELLKGGYPAMYGGRLTSVLNVMNKEGNRKEFHGVARLSLLSANATLEGPWKKGSWMLSARRTYVDFALKMAKINLPYYFYDGHAKFNYDINKNNQASASVYLGDDVLDLSQDGSAIKLDWGNKTFSTQWTHLFSSRLFSHFVFAGSRFESKSNATFDDISFGVFNQITDLSLKGSLTYSPNTIHSMDFGFEGKALDFKLNYKIVGTTYKNAYDGKYAALYFQDNLKLSSLTILQTGLRLDHYSDGRYTRLGPRLSIKRLLSDQSNVTVSYGRYSQFLNLVQMEGMSFADMWFPVDKTFSPGLADHYIVGYNFDNQKTFSVNAEAYYKRYDNLAEYRIYRGAGEGLDHITATQNFYVGKGYAYGADMYIRNQFKRLDGWIGYSYCRTRKKTDGYNFDKEYFPTYDRRHTITLIEDYRLSRKWRVNFAFKYGSGQPYTEATARYTVVSPDGTISTKVLEGEKNFYRLPAYHRLDVGVFLESRLFGLDTEYYLQVVNVYDHKNVWYRRYQTVNNPATVKDYSQIPILPTFGLSVKF